MNIPRSCVLVLVLFCAVQASAFYDPNVQKWPNRDPIEELGSLNLYTFVLNNSVNMRDIWGLLTEVLTFDPVGKGKSSFGHTAINLNGTVFSFGEKGWFKERTEDYMDRNSFRNAYGQELKLTSEQEAALKDLLDKDMERNPRWTPDNNCSTRAREMLNQATGGQLDGMPPTPYPKDFYNLLELIS